MAVEMTIDPVSFKKLNKRFKLMGKHYPEETYRAIVKILFDMKLIAQRKIKADKHIVTARLRNSLFVKTIKQKFANRATNKKGYTFTGGSGDRDLNVKLRNDEGAFGTNVIYGQKIEDLDSFIEYAVQTVDVNKRLREVPEAANKKIIR
jgi:hypothetical protein